jgi:hypothetical protein
MVGEEKGIFREGPEVKTPSVWLSQEVFSHLSVNER